MKNFGEKGAWAYPGTAQIFWVPPIISGTGKARNFKFCTHILSIDRNKSPLQISGKVAGCVVRTLETFQGTHILGASRGRLCDSSAVLFHQGIAFSQNSKFFRPVITSPTLIFTRIGIRRWISVHINRISKPNNCQFFVKGLPMYFPTPTKRRGFGWPTFCRDATTIREDRAYIFGQSASFSLVEEMPACAFYCWVFSQNSKQHFVWIFALFNGRQC